MKIYFAGILLFAFSATLIGQASEPAAQIRDIRAQSNHAIQANDIDGFASSLAPDFVVVTGNGSFLSRADYIAAFQKDFKDPHSVRFERISQSIQLSSSLPLAAESGDWIGRVPGGPVLFRGTYMAMWRKSGESWLLRSELFVSLSCADAVACEAYRKRYNGSK